MSSFLKMKILSPDRMLLRSWTPRTLLHRLPLLHFSLHFSLLLILPPLISLIWISLLIQLNIAISCSEKDLLLSPKTCQAILFGQATGAWLTSMPPLYHKSTELSAQQELCDTLFLYYAHPLIFLLTVMNMATSSLSAMTLPAPLVIFSLPTTMDCMMSKLADIANPCLPSKCCL